MHTFPNETEPGGGGATVPPEQAPPVEQAPPEQAAPAGGGIPTVDGCPLFVIGTPFGEHNVAVLASYDPEATHEQNQPATHPETDQAPEHPMERSGGAAYYFDLIAGKGWSVALGKDG